MKFRIIAILLVAACIFSSCDNPTKNGRRRRSASLLTPVSSGNPYEVMVVADDSIWEGYAGRALQTILDKPLAGLPQKEPQFHKSHITESHYDKITNLFRNIFRIEISNEYTKAKMTVEKDVHSTPQMILTLHAPNQVEASVYITEHSKGIEGLITSEEINRMANDLYFQHNVKFAKKVKEMFDCEFYIPFDIKKMKVGEDFIWASDDGLSSIQNICLCEREDVHQRTLHCTSRHHHETKHPWWKGRSVDANQRRVCENQKHQRERQICHGGTWIVGDAKRCHGWSLRQSFPTGREEQSRHCG